MSEVAESSADSAKRAVPQHLVDHAFKPGQSGNPGGRPKNDLSALLARRAYELISSDEAVLNKAAKQVANLICKNPKMAQVMADRGFGKVPQTLNIQGELNVSTTVADRLRAARKRAK